MSRSYAIVGASVVVAAAIIVALVMMWSGDEVVEDGTPVVVETPLPEPTPTPTLQEQLSARLAGATLANSDSIVGELVAELSAHPELAAWLANEDLVRRFVATVDNVADGVSPRPHLGFLRPKKGFAVIEKRGLYTIDPRSYRRFDKVAEVVGSLDTDGTVALYGEVRPLALEAYREIAPPNRTFDDRLIAAIDHLLAVPVLGKKVEVERKVLTYSYADEQLEGLSAAQRDLLRMGPDNVKTIQDKLEEIKRALQAPPDSDADPLEGEAAE